MSACLKNEPVLLEGLVSAVVEQLEVVLPKESLDGGICTNHL